MPELNITDYRSLLEEDIARVLHEYGVPVALGDDGAGADLIADIATADGSRHLTVEVKAAIPTGGPRRGRRADVLAHPYVSARLAKSYREQGLFYVDSIGNAYIVVPGFRVDVQGRKPESTSTTGQIRPRRAFGFAGAKLIFALLVDQHAVEHTVRDLSHLSGVATGTVSATLHDLERNGFLATTAKGRRRLRRTEQLTELWISSYITRISPRLEEISLAGPDPQWWISSPPTTDACLGGGAAMASMGFDLAPATTLAYGRPPWASIRRLARLRRDHGTNVTLREQFWAPELNPSPMLVPPLLVYADAMASDDPRQIEAAEELWERNDDLRRLRARR